MKNSIPMIISILTILLLIIITGTAYSQTVNQTTENAVLKISHPFTISLFSSKLNSSSTINIFQKYLTQSNEIIIYWLQTPSYFKVENTLFPYFPNHTRAIEVPNISAIQGVINEVAPLALTKDRDLIVYDPEVWSVTPTTEYDYTQAGGKGISQSISQSADMVHLAGYLFGVAPELKGPPGPQSPSLVGHYQEIDWTKVDYLFIQSQLVINSESDLQVEKQIYNFVKSQSPKTQVVMNVGFSKSADFSPSEIISALNYLQFFDGIQIMYLPINGCLACTDYNLDSLFSKIGAQNQVGYYKIPQWIKHNAEWWANGQIEDDDFMKGMGYLINQNIIIIPAVQPASAIQQGIPTWIKNDAKLWSEDSISNDDFIKGLQYLIQNGIIKTSLTPQNVTTGKQLLLHIFSPNNPSELIAIFDKHTTTNDFISNFRTQTLDLYPRLNHCLSAYSIDSINAAIETAKAHDSIKYIAYDNEKGNGNLSTPQTEMVDPAASTNEAARLVKRAGLGFSAQPTHAILMQEYKGVDWTKVDFMVMQMQKFTKDPSFTSDVTTVSNWIKSKNPDTKIFVQINTAFDNTPHLISLTKSVSDKIDGVSVVIPDTATIEPLLVGIGR